MLKRIGGLWMLPISVALSIVGSLSAAVTLFEQRALVDRITELEVRHALASQAVSNKGLTAPLPVQIPADSASAVASSDAAHDGEDIPVAESATKGSADAKLMMVEFSDFECPFCARYWRDTFGSIKREYIDQGKLLYVFRHFPLEEIHSRAFGAAQAAECARQRGKFWEMHALLFSNQRALTQRDLVQHGFKVGINQSSLRECLEESGEVVRGDKALGTSLGVQGTPMFFIGTLQTGGRLRVMRKLNGAHAFAAFKEILDEALLGTGS